MSNPEVVLTKDDKEDLSNFAKRPTLKFQSESNETLSSSSNSHYSLKEGKSNYQEVEEEYQEICRISVPKQGDSSSSSTSKFKDEDEEEEEEEEEDGYKTPTSLDHKISVLSKCPPAPRKTKPSLKRKASYYNHRNNCRHPLDLSKEVFELLFPSQHHISPLSTSQQSIKKVRRQEHKS